MRKNCLLKNKIFLSLLLIVCIFSIINLKNVEVFSATNTDSEYVNTVSDLKTTSLPGTATLYEQKMSSLLNGDNGKAFEEHFVQWVDMESYNSGLQLATWTLQNADSWKQATTKNCALDWEKHHPGWIVVAGINGDFFNNKGTLTYEPTNNFMQDGEMYRADYVGGARKVIGITDDNKYIVGDPDISGLKLQILSNDNVTEEFSFTNYNNQPSGDGLFLLTKDKMQTFDLTGYTVYVGEYEMCRISNGTNQTVFVKGEIKSSREGTINERPKETREFTDDDGSTIEKKVREFYIVTKDESYKEKLIEGTKVRCQHNYQGSWSNVTQSCGFIFQMLVNGKSQYQGATNDDLIYTNHPRTFIGFKEDGTPVMMVVDGRGKTSTAKNKGVSLFQGAELMKLAGCVNAYNLDGGGSSTLIVRNENGGFDIINRPSDGTENGMIYKTQAEKESWSRPTGNAIFLVMRDPGFTSNESISTTTSVVLNKKSNELFDKMENITVTIDGITKNIENDQSEFVFDGLLPGNTYNAIINYSIDDEKCTSSIEVKTKEYIPNIKIEPGTYDFKITKEDTDPNIKIESINLKIDDESIQIENVNKYTIGDLLKDTSYFISYTYTLVNVKSNLKQTIEVPVKEYKTLSYELPLIETFEEGRKTDDSLRIKYKYEDEDNLVTKAYIYLNDDKYELNTKSGNYTFNDLDFNKNTYIIKLVIIYMVDGVEKEFESTVLTYEKPACVHEYDNACDKECNKCSETRVVEDHKWVDATCQKAKHCSVCNKTEGDKLPHTEVVDKGYDATCEKEGLTDGSHCSVCNEVIKEQTKIEKKEHTWVDATKKAPKTCSVCGETEGSKLKGCKKASVLTILSSVTLLTSSLILVRKKR